MLRQDNLANRVITALKYRYLVAVVVFILLIAVSLFIFLGPPELEEKALLPEITPYTKRTAIPYENDSNSYHQLDVYLPEGEGPFPALIYVHGGGWVQGNRTDFNKIAALYAKRGIAGFSIDYTLSTENNTAWPQDINDVIAALEFVRKNADFYHVNAEKIALMGSSAGAQLVSLVGTLSGNESFISTPTQEPLKSQVCLVINYDGATDLEYIGENFSPYLIYNIVTSGFGNISYSENPALWRQASPATYISSDEPPFVFVHGTKDVVVPIAVAESFNNKLQNAGVETYFIRVDGDHDVLTSDELNLQARYQLDPLLSKAFDLKISA